MLSICFVSQEYPEETGWGGIGTYTFELAHGLARAGHRVVVVSRGLTQPSQYVESDGVEVFRVVPSLSLNATPLLWRLNRYWEGYGLAVARQLKQILKDRSIDLIECPELHAETLLHSFFNSRPPLVVRLHSGSALVSKFEANGSHGKKWNARMEDWLIEKAARVTSPSQALLSANNFRDRGRFTIIPNPVDIDHFKPAFAASNSDATPNIVCVGRPRPLKGIHVLAQAIPLIWQTMPKCIFTFVPAPMGKGGSSPDDAYDKILGDLKADSRVRIVAPVSRAELPQLYNEATLCVVPSLWEGFGYVCAEAMACGRPVVASRVGGLEEIVEDGCSGVLVEPGNAKELANAILNLLHDSERRDRLSAAARSRIVENFSRTVIATRAAEFYQQVVQEVSH